LEKTPNDKFREARHRTASSANPKECLSRRELADQANAWIWERHHTKRELDGSYIGKLEQGVIRWPNTLCREAFRVILGVSKDSELGFVNARARYYRAVVKLDDVKRRKLFENATALGVSGLVLRTPMAALLETSEPTPIPARVGASDIEHIRSAKQVFLSWSFTYGGGLVRDAVMAHVRWLARVLDESTYPDQLRPKLFSAVGDLADTAGFIVLDAGADEEARRVFSFALGCAEQAEDWLLRAEVLSDMTGHAIRTGRPDEGLTLAELALVRPDRLTATVLAKLHTDRAFALVTMRRVQETLRAIGTADEHFAHSTPDNDPPFMAYYNADVHAGYTGRRLADLAILGRDPGEATDRLTAAAITYARPRAMCLAKLASLTMATGDPLQAVAIGHEALEAVGSIHSRLAADELRDLYRYAAAHQQLEEVEHLRQRIATLVGTENP